jgi:hypothetical protein
MTTKKYLILIVTALICSAVIFFIRHQHAGKIFLRAVPFESVNGWGYNIMANDKIYIHQDDIPGLPGRQGFKTEKEALSVGQRVVEKISHNELPSITQKDLDELGIGK